MELTPWHKYALISYLAREVGKSFYFGKTKLQKVVFLMKELLGIPVDYQFEFYTYGPYSADLSGDLSFVECLGGVDVSYQDKYDGYEIRVGQKGDDLIEKAPKFFSKYSGKIDEIVERFGHKNAGELELIASIVYVLKYDRPSGSKEPSEVLRRIKELKPRFSEAEVRAAFEELERFGYYREAIGNVARP